MGLSVPSLSTCCLWAGLWNAPFEQVGARRVPAPSCGLCRQREGMGHVLQILHLWGRNPFVCCAATLQREPGYGRTFLRSPVWNSEVTVN